MSSADDANRRLHIVCPSNGGCTVIALALCELLDAACISDFSCLTYTFADGPRLLKSIEPTASSAADALSRWRARGAHLVVKNTISPEAPDTLRLLGSNFALPPKKRDATRLRALREAATRRVPPPADFPASGFFTHTVLYLRDPVQQYLAVREKWWCMNCGGFVEKLQTQEALLRRCIHLAPGGGAPSVGSAPSGGAHCPFDALLLDHDIFDTSDAPRGSSSSAPGRLAARLGLRDGSINGSTLRAVHVRAAARAKRNAALGLGHKMLNFGNMKGGGLRPRYASRRPTWTCATAARVRALLPTLYQLYHPMHCDDPRVRNASDAAVREWTAAGRRRASQRRADGIERPVSLVCDSFVDTNASDCSYHNIRGYRSACESIERAWRGTRPL
jgi:hypothetical protein